MDKNIIITGRNEALDMMKCVGILSVIAGHFSHSLQPMTSSFHMPLFFIISGYFFNTKRTIKESVTKDVNHLLIPYLVSCTIVLLYWLVTGLKYGNYEEFFRYLQGVFWTNQAIQPFSFTTRPGQELCGFLWPYFGVNIHIID